MHEVPGGPSEARGEASAWERAGAIPDQSVSLTLTDRLTWACSVVPLEDRFACPGLSYTYGSRRRPDAVPAVQSQGDAQRRCRAGARFSSVARDLTLSRLHSFGLGIFK